MKIQWNQITPYEYIGYIHNDFYLMDYYEDFEDAKIKEDSFNEELTKVENNFIFDTLTEEECTIAIIKNIDNEFTTIEEYVLVLKDKQLYITKNLIEE